MKQERALQMLRRAIQAVEYGRELTSIVLRDGSYWPDGEPRYVLSLKGRVPISEAA